MRADMKYFFYIFLLWIPKYGELIHSHFMVRVKIYILKVKDQFYQSADLEPIVFPFSVSNHCLTNLWQP